MALPPLSMPDIADLAGVRRPVVTTWRRRYADFPSPCASDTASPLFGAREVADWLIGTGRASAHDIEPDLALFGLARLTDRMPGERLVAALTALLCLRHLDGRPLRPGAATGGLTRVRRRARAVDPNDAMLAGEIEALGDDAGWLVTAAEELVEAAWDTRGAFRQVLARRHRLGADRTCRGEVVAELAALVAGLSGAAERATGPLGHGGIDELAEGRAAVGRPGAGSTAGHGTMRIADLAAGSGDLIAAVLDALGEATAPDIMAAEPDEATARLLRRRLAVTGPRDATVTTAVDLEVVAPDVVLYRMPYRPGEDRDPAAELDAVTDVTDLLPTGATAVVLGPADTLTEPLAYGPAERRGRLLAAGNVETVVRLPGGCLPYRPGYRLALWVVRRERGNRESGRVLAADLSHRAITASDVDELVTDVVTWRRDGYRPGERSLAFAVPVAAAELAASGTAPRRPARLGGTAPQARAVELEARLAAPARPTPVRGTLAPRTGQPPRTTTLGTLLRQRAILVVKGTRLRAGHAAARGTHPVLGALEATGAVAVGTRFVDRAVFAAEYPNADLTRAGDVVVTVRPRLGVLVDTDGLSVVEFPARVLRIADGEVRFTPRTLAALLAVGHPGVRAAGAVHEPLRLDRYPLPLLDAAETARLDAVLAAVADRRAGARAELSTLDELESLVAGAVLAGTHTVAADPAGSARH